MSFFSNIPANRNKNRQNGSLMEEKLSTSHVSVKLLIRRGSKELKRQRT